MNKVKRSILLLLACMIPGMLSGCGMPEEEVTEVVSEMAGEIPPLPEFVQKPERTVTQIELPENYYYIEESRPQIRNQEGTNTCWAFASLSALESSKDEDVQGGYAADHLIYQNPFENSFDEGGTYMVTMSYLLSWSGPVAEAADPFDGKSEGTFLPEVHVQEIRQIEPKDYETIKRFVYLYGGVESALYLDFDEYMENSECYNEEKFSYCYQGEASSNHDVVIIGWDDQYPAENFVGNVTEDGAFLCQNSWGENFGDQGIFYVSYEDVNIGGYGVVYSRVDGVDNYDQIYQSDLCGYTAQIGYEQEDCWFANVYQAESDIFLRAAGFYATGAHTEYEIYVVSNFEDEKSFKNRKYVSNGFLEDAGYYTVDFSEPVEIEAGADFAVVVKIMTANAEYPVAIECQVEGLSENADLTDGCGYLSYQGSLWEHIESTKDYNICLKAYADLR